MNKEQYACHPDKVIVFPEVEKKKIRSSEDSKKLIQDSYPDYHQGEVVLVGSRAQNDFPELKEGALVKYKQHGPYMFHLREDIESSKRDYFEGNDAPGYLSIDSRDILIVEK